MSDLLSRPTQKAQIVSGNNWVAATPDRHMLFLKNDNLFRKIFNFQNSIIKILFSPSANTVYVIDSHAIIWKRSLTQRSLTNEAQNFVFSELIHLPFAISPESFITLIPYEKALYLIINSHLYMLIDNQIHSEFDINCEITVIKAIPLELAKKFQFVDENCSFQFIILCGTSEGSVATLTFPNTLTVHNELSQPFISKSEAISNIAISSKFVFISGKYGTIVNKSKKGCFQGIVQFPVAALSINDPNILFVSKGRLYSAPIMNPSSFSIVSSFPATIAAACSGYCLISNGSLVSFDARAPISLSPRSDIFEFSLNRIDDINQENEKVLSQISELQAKLGDSQIIKWLKNGNKVLESEFSITPSISPDGRTILTCLVKLTPLSAYSCKGLTVILSISSPSDSQSVYCLPNVQTFDVSWEFPVTITTTAAVTANLAVSYGNEAAVLQSTVLDVIELSAPVDLKNTEIGFCFNRLSKESVQESFAVMGSAPKIITEPMARKAPTGEVWSMTFDGKVCTVNAATRSTVMSVIAAVERRLQAKGTFSIGDRDDELKKLRDAADKIFNSYDSLPVGGNIKGRVESLHSMATKLANQILSQELS